MEMRKKYDTSVWTLQWAHLMWQQQQQQGDVACLQHLLTTAQQKVYTQAVRHPLLVRSTLQLCSGHVMQQNKFHHTHDLIMAIAMACPHTAVGSCQTYMSVSASVIKTRTRTADVMMSESYRGPKMQQHRIKCSRAHRLADVHVGELLGGVPQVLGVPAAREAVARVEQHGAAAQRHDGADAQVSRRVALPARAAHTVQFCRHASNVGVPGRSSLQNAAA